MSTKKNESPAQANNEQSKSNSLQLSKNSESELVKSYFSKVFELKQTGKQFPVNLDDVWPLIYDRKDHAVRSLKSDFIENEDYIIQKTENQQIPKNEEQRTGFKKINAYFLSVECLEYFIVKKVKPVFEVYRQVFHKAVEGNNQQIKLAQFAARFKEETRETVRMGDSTTQVYVKSGVIYAKLSPIMRYLGYMSSQGSAITNRLGLDNCVFVDDGTAGQASWFININGFEALIQMTTLDPHPSKIYAIRHDVFGIDTAENSDPYTFKFTDGEMNTILMELICSPRKKSNVVVLLKKGQKEGGQA